VAEFWVEWGILAYAGAAAWAFFEGETFVLLAAAAGQATGLVDPWLLMTSVWVGSFAGDQVWFALGRRYGRSAVRRFPRAEKRLAAAVAFVEHYGDLFVLSFRFAYGIRNVASAACGMAGMSRIRFALLNFVAAGIWAGSSVAVGWLAASWLGATRLAWTIGVVGLGFFIVLVWRFARHRRAALAGPAG
jgi:membrane protein DedA with SNARE-associated domain